MKPLRVLMMMGLLLGCATTYSANKAKAMYVAEFQCSEGDVQTENVDGASAVLVKGCGYQQLYACANGACVANGPRRELSSNPTGN